jgi:hypothetical protein
MPQHRPPLTVPTPALAAVATDNGMVTVTHPAP